MIVARRRGYYASVVVLLITFIAWLIQPQAILIEEYGGVTRLAVRIGFVMAFPAAVALMALRLAAGMVVSLLALAVLPILALLSGGGLIVSIGFACAGQWHEAVKGLWACLVSSVALGLLAGLAQLVNPTIFCVLVTMTDRRSDR